MEDSPDDEPELPINYHAVVLSRVRDAHAFVALMWVLSGLMLAVVEVMMLIAIMYSIAFKRCRKMDDCPFGYMCVHATNALYETLTCEDCALSCIWGNKYSMPYSGTFDPNVEAKTISEYCEGVLDQLPGEGFAVPMYSTPTYSTDVCFFVESNRSKMSTLGEVTLYLACLVICAFAVQERMQQLCIMQIRKAYFPLLFRPQQWRSGVRDVLLPLLLIATEVVSECVLLPLVPASFTLLLLFTGMHADNILLAGVGVAFVLELDDIAAHFMLTYPQRTAVNDILNSMVAESRNQRVQNIRFKEQRILAMLRGVFIGVTFYVLFHASRTVMCEYIFTYTINLSFWWSIAPCCVEMLAPMLRAYMSKNLCLRSLGAGFVSLIGSALYYTLGGCFYACFLALGWFIYYHYLPDSIFLRFLFWDRNKIMDGNGDAYTSNTCPSEPEHWAYNCVNWYEISQDEETCDELLSEGSLTCESDFCPTCAYFDYCDKSCGYGYCSDYWQTILDPTDGATPTASQMPANVLPLKRWEFVPLNAAGNNRDE